AYTNGYRGKAADAWRSVAKNPLLVVRFYDEGILRHAKRVPQDKASKREGGKRPHSCETKKSKPYSERVTQTSPGRIQIAIEAKQPMRGGR
ncbi:MAG: hypothetical protein ACK5XL_10890, partial [Cyclobacteriaceae bacterium]